MLCLSGASSFGIAPPQFLTLEAPVEGWLLLVASCLGPEPTSVGFIVARGSFARPDGILLKQYVWVMVVIVPTEVHT